ncbi:MAG: 30S ribosomal protein THX [Planctomycetota bacterium]
MGRGDRRTRRGKIWRGTYGKTRLHGKKKVTKEATPAENKNKTL